MNSQDQTIKGTLHDIELDNGSGLKHGHIVYIVTFKERDISIDEAIFQPFDNNGEELPEEQYVQGNEKIDLAIINHAARKA